MPVFVPIFLYLLVFVILFSLAYSDLKEYILPNRLNAALAISLASFHISTNWQILTPPEALLGALAGGGFLLFIRTLSDKFYKPDSLGLGDVKLMAAAGLGLGYPNIMLALSLGAGLGLLHGFYMSCAARKKTGRKIPMGEVNVPAGAGLAAGIALTMIYAFGFEWLRG